MKKINYTRPSYFKNELIHLMAEWIASDFTQPFSTVFKSCQDDGRLIMKGCVHWNPA